MDMKFDMKRCLLLGQALLFGKLLDTELTLKAGNHISSALTEISAHIGSVGCQRSRVLNAFMGIPFGVENTDLFLIKTKVWLKLGRSRLTLGKKGN